MYMKDENNQSCAHTPKGKKVHCWNSEIIRQNERLGELARYLLCR